MLGSTDPEDIYLALRGSHRVNGTLGQQSDDELRELAAKAAARSAKSSNRRDPQTQRVIREAFSARLAQEGRDLHRKLLKAGGATRAEERPVLDRGLSNPRVIINVPEQEWDTLNDWQRQLLMRYVASMVEAVRQDPFAYCPIPRTAPVAPAILRNARGMGERSWGIIVGRVDRDGYIIADRLPASGHEIDIEKLPLQPK